MWKHNPGLSTDSGEGADTTAVELVAATGAHDLKVQGLVKLSELLRLEAQTDDHLTLSWDDPPENA